MYICRTTQDSKPSLHNFNIKLLVPHLLHANGLLKCCNWIKQEQSGKQKKKNPPWKRREWALGSSLPRELRRTPALQLLLWSLLLRHCCWLYPACTQLVSVKLLLKKWLEPSCVCPWLQLISTRTGGKQEYSSMAAFIAASSSTLRDALCEKLWFHSAFCVLRIRKGRFLQ